LSIMRLACVQLEPRDDQELEPVLRSARRKVLEAAPADLIILPELWSTGYFAFDEYAERAQPLDGPIVSWGQSLALEAETHLHLGSFLERRPDGSLANTSVVFAPDGSTLAEYRKIHVFGYGSREAELVEEGDSVVVTEVAGTTLGLAICYDLRFPELFRRLVQMGAECIAVPATWPRARRSHWTALLHARAIENLCVVAGCNASGYNCGVEIGGGSLIIDPWGDSLAEAGPGEMAISAIVDLGEVRKLRAEFPALADRRDWIVSRATSDP